MPEPVIPHVAHAEYNCPWCWRAFYPATPFPVGENGKLCKEHYNWLARQVKAYYTTHQGGQPHDESSATHRRPTDR